MIILTVTLLVLVSLGVVLYPLLAHRDDSSPDGDLAHELTQRLRRARDRVYEELRVLQQEYFLKHLSEQEYQAQVEAARIRAALLLRQQEQVQHMLARLDGEVEEEVRRILADGSSVSQEDRPRS